MQLLRLYWVDLFESGWFGFTFRFTVAVEWLDKWG